MDSEEQLCQYLDQAAQGDLHAASQLLQSYQSRIYGYLRRLAGNDSDAEDLTQETFRRVWTSLDRFNKKSTVSTWIFRIAYCTWIDWVRQASSSRERDYGWCQLQANRLRLLD